MFLALSAFAKMQVKIIYIEDGIPRDNAKRMEEKINYFMSNNPNIVVKNVTISSNKPTSSRISEDSMLYACILYETK